MRELGLETNMAFTRKVWLRSIIYLSFFICLFVNFVNSEDVPYTLHNSPSKLDTVIVLDRYKRDTNVTSSSISENSTSAPDSTAAAAGSTQNPSNSSSATQSPSAAVQSPSVTTQSPATTQSPTTQSPTTQSPTTNRPTTGSPGTPSTAAPPPGTTQTPQMTTTPDYAEIKDKKNHKYYKYTAYNAGSMWWEELWDPSNNQQLSGSHRLAVSVTTQFKFLFYGHEVNKITIATGGFLYMSPFLHQWLTATQYIAPLMANFDTTIGNDSEILYKDFGQKFVVEWRNVFLQDQNHTNPFSFQTSLFTNGTIMFSYQQVPIDVISIENKNHPVKIGLSDAFYIDSVVGGKQRRTIYEYHNVQINFTLVSPGTTIVLDPLTTCNRAPDCETCLTQDDEFDCKWCSKLQRCSDGVDWQRQEWRDQNCEILSTQELDMCNVTLTLPPTTTTTAAPVKPCVGFNSPDLCQDNETVTDNTSTPVPTTSNSSNLPSSTPVISTPATTTSPIPSTSTPAPTTLTPQPTTSTPQSTTPTPQPTTSTPLPTTSAPLPTSTSSDGMTDTSEQTRQSTTAMRFTGCRNGKGDCSSQKSDSNSNPAGTVVVVLVVIVLLIIICGVAGWFYFAYTHPTSASGMWLMEHRPSQMKQKVAKIKFWKRSTSSGEKYAVEADA